MLVNKTDCKVVYCLSKSGGFIGVILGSRFLSSLKVKTNLPAAFAPTNLSTILCSIRIRSSCDGTPLLNEMK